MCFSIYILYPTIPMANFISAPLTPASTAFFSVSTSRSDYDVFISYRGPDAKRFANDLYERLEGGGLKVFFDKSEMEEGQNIGSQIEEAIRGASVYIAILSPRYAESRWCLDELVLMMDCMQINLRATILPVFYKVDPSVVRWTVDKGAYAEALQILEQKTTFDSETREKKPRYCPDTIQRWRQALSEVGNLSGFVLPGDKDDRGMLLDHEVHHDEWMLLERVVKSVWKKVPKPLLDVATHPTGLDLKLEEFEKTVFCQQEPELVEAKVVGIVGAGGVGKTTLAKAFFNQISSNYKSSSFIFDTRENVRNKSLHYLHNKLLRDLRQMSHREIESRDEGIGVLKRYLSSCHVFVVLDDVDHREQLDAVLPIKKILDPNSLILVTSRHKRVLEESGVLESSIYILKGMTIEHSKELFCFHAFHQSVPIPEFADLVDQFVKSSDGLPLILRVLGARVCGEHDRSIWQEMLDKLEKILPDEIQDRLKVSYDFLSATDKETFLDIVCFFIGEDRDKAMRIWGKVAIGNLEDSCLVEVDGKNKIKMHDHIRDMGRNIAEEASMPRRLWHCTTSSFEDLLERQSSVIKEVRGIKMVSYCDDVFRDREERWFLGLFSSPEMSSPENIETRHLLSSKSLEMRHKNLVLVATEEGYVEDILRSAQSPNLMWLRWYKCYYISLPDWIPMKNLRSLEVTGSRLNKLWSHHSQAVPLQLRELNVYAPLSEIPKSIAQLKHLERVAICHPSSPEAVTLKRLPHEFCRLLSLKYLVFNGFSRMVSLPESFGELINLQHLDLKGATSLQMLPNSFGRLTRLKYLCLRGCENLTFFNGTLGDISMLEYLDLSSCKQVKELPPQVAHQRSLKTLYLKKTNLKELPSFIEDLCNLEVLKLSSDLLEVLPHQVGDIKNLKVLSISSSPQLKSLPDSIGLLSQLTRLKIRRCGIEYLPQHLLKMNNLESLVVSDCPLREHLFEKEVEGERETVLSLKEERALNKSNSLNNKCMFGLNELVLSQTEREVFFDGGVCPNLQKLTLSRCNQIGGLCGLPKLRNLNVRSCAKVEELPGLETLLSMERLFVDGCDKLQSIQGLGKLRKLRSLTVWKCPEILELPGVECLTSLERLSVWCCDKLQNIPGLWQLTKLRSLNVDKCHGIKELPGVECLTSLESLTVIGCEIAELQGLEHLIYLEWLDVSDCKKLQSIPGFGQLPNLQKLFVSNCPKIPELPSVEYLTSLTGLYVFDCDQLESIHGLGQLTELETLHVEGCREMRELPGVEHLFSLKNLCIRNCQKLQSIPELGKLTHLRGLDVSGFRELRELPCVEHFTYLLVLTVRNCEKLQSIPWLGHFTTLKELDVSGCCEIPELPGLERLTCLEKLNVSGLVKLKSIQGLGQLTHIRELDVARCHEIPGLPGLENLVSLEKLNVSGLPNLKRIKGLRNFTQILELDVSECHEIQELTGLEHLTCLEKLNVSGLGKLKSMQGLGQLTHIRELDVSRCHEIQELTGLENLASLWKLNVSGLGKLKSMQGLGQLTHIRELDVSRCHEIQELTGLENLASLRKLNVSGLGKLKSIQELPNFTQIRELDVSECREIAELPGLEHLTCLEKLNVTGLGKLKSMQGLGQLTHMRELDVSRCHEIPELPGLGNLSSLKKLNVSGLEKLKSIQGLLNLTQIIELDVSKCHEIAELTGLEHLTSLEKLNVSGLEKLKSIPGLGRLTEIKDLNVCECFELQELAGVEYLMSLEILNACKCPKLQWSEGVVEQLLQQLKDGFKYDKERERCSCLQFLPCLRFCNLFSV